MTKSVVSEEALRIHNDSIVIDGLSGAISNGYAQAKSGGITALNVSMGGASDKPNLTAMLQAASENMMILSSFPEDLAEILSVADIKRAKADGKLGVIFGTQSSDFLGTSIHLVPIFHRLGLRILQLTYSERCEAGYGVAEPNDLGLTAFGIRLIRELNRLGIVIDLSHVGYTTASQAIELSERPVIFSHSNPRSIADNHRNIPDSLITACAEKGGVIGVCGYATLVETRAGVRPTFDDWVTHIQYVVDLVGIDHVGVSTDMFEGRTKFWHAMRGQFMRYKDTYSSYSSFDTRHVEGLQTLADLPRLTHALLERGLGEPDIKKILGENFLRVYEQNWRVSSQATK